MNMITPLELHASGRVSTSKSWLHRGVASSFLSGSNSLMETVILQRTIFLQREQICENLFQASAVAEKDAYKV